MKRIAAFIKDKWFYILSIIIPWCIVLLYSYVNDTWITGRGNMGSGDLTGQIIPIAYSLWDKIHMHDSLAFTWNLMDGVDYSTVVGYMLSPFTIIMLLLPRVCLPGFIQFEMIAKWSLVSLSTVFFFYNTKYNTLKHNKKLISLYLGLAYTLGNGIVSYMLYIQFTDALICFPLLLILVERMVEDNSWKLYYLVLTFTIFTNSYLAFQMCIFLVIWFVFQYNAGVKDKLRKFITFALSSVFAAITNFGILLTSLNVASGRLTMDNSEKITIFTSQMLIKPYEFTKQLFVYEDIMGPGAYVPNIYFSVIGLFLVLIFPFIRMGAKRKLYMLGVTAFFVVSFFSGHINLIWHLFKVPNGVYNRFMYLFVFFMLFLVLYTLIYLEKAGSQQIIAGSILSIVLFVYTFFTVETYDYFITYFLTAMILAFMIIVMILYKRKSITYSNVLCVVAICGIIELSFNCYNSFYIHDSDLYYGKNGFVEAACEDLDDAQLEAGERIAAALPSPNIGFVTNQNSDSGFISAINVANMELHKRLGMATNGEVMFLSRGASPLANLIFNVRYGYGESELLYSDAEYVSGDAYLSMYRMKRLAGLGYMVDDSIVDWNAENKNCFQYQNDFVEKAVEGDTIFKPFNPDITCTDYREAVYNYDPTMAKEGTYCYLFKGMYGGEYDAKQFDFTVYEDADIYMSYASGEDFRLYIIVDGEQKHIDNISFETCTYHLGELKKGQKVQVVAMPLSEILKDKGYNIFLTFGKFDEESYSSSYEKLSNNVYNIETMESDYVKGSIHVDKHGIMMTSIPSLPGFTVYVDGQEKQYETIGGAMIGVPMDKGDHTVEFRYVTPNARVGFFISAGLFAIFIVICIAGGRRKKTIADSEDVIVDEVE